MPGILRAITVGYPYHISQRGNYRQTVFKEAEDYTSYEDKRLKGIPAGIPGWQGAGKSG